jgi:signal transduction histidine kinase
LTDDPASTVNDNTQENNSETDNAQPDNTQANIAVSTTTGAGAAVTGSSEATPPSEGADGPAPGELFGIAFVELPSQISAQQRVLNHVFLLAAGLLAGLTAIVVLSFIITRLILRPVRVLQDTAEKVGEGDLNVRVKITSGDEFEHLASTFNRMLRNLQQSTEQLSAANRSLDLQIVKLNESNSALAEANRLKSEFLASVSHELRTPLNSILGFAELLRSGGLPEDARTARYLQNIITGGHNLLDLINDLLDLAKIEAGRADVRVISFSLSDLFEALTGLLKPLAEKRKLHIRVTVSPDVPIIQSDSAKLQQVLYNLLSNAIKFSPDGSVIDLMATRVADDMVQISVVDRGPGIAPEHHSTIFEKFRQLDQGITRTHGGTGLGLSISRELVRLLGGTITVESQLGQGATFRVSLPLSIESGLRETRPLSIGG